MKKLYVYVDETGQDTLGKVFIVVTIIIASLKDTIETKLKDLELKTGKRLKWRKSNYLKRLEFMKFLSSLVELKYCVFWSEYEGSTSYKDLTALSIAKSILHVTKENYKAIVIVDCLTKSDGQRLGAILRRLRIRTEKVLGDREERNVFLRLADSYAGLVRDALEKKKAESNVLKNLMIKKLIKKI